MAILINKNTRVICQNITGTHGSFHAQKCAEYGTQIVGGVNPGKGGTHHNGIPVFNTVREARKATGCDATMIFVPAAGGADAILEAADAELDLIVCITEGIPALDMLRVVNHIRGKKSRLIGPNCPGIITPGQCKIGIMPGAIHKPGHVGVISRSGTLTYEVVDQLSGLDIGQSSCIGIGGDPLIGTSFIDALDLFNRDPDTHAVVMIGEIGGSAEEEAAEWIKANMKKPVAGFISGMTAPPGKRMGHAGAIISRGKGTAAEKIRVLEECGVRMVRSPALIGDAIKAILK